MVQPNRVAGRGNRDAMIRRWQRFEAHDHLLLNDSGSKRPRHRRPAAVLYTNGDKKNVAHALPILSGELCSVDAANRRHNPSSNHAESEKIDMMMNSQCVRQTHNFIGQRR